MGLEGGFATDTTPILRKVQAHVIQVDDTISSVEVRMSFVLLTLRFWGLNNPCPSIVE